MNSLFLPFSLTGADSLPPTYGTQGAAALDFYSTKEVSLGLGDIVMVPLGVIMEVPLGYGLFLLPRSGLAAKYGITLANGVGLIDSDYRGEVCALLHRCFSTTPAEPVVLPKGSRVCQGLLLPVPPIHLILKAPGELTQTERGAKGFGSTGVSDGTSL